MSLAGKLSQDLSEISAYGEPGSKLLPTVLALLWSEVALSEQLAADFGFRGRATLGHLINRFERGLSASSPEWNANDFEAALNYVLRFAHVKRNEIQSLPVLPRNWPTILRPDDVPWGARTRSCLEKAGLLDRYENLRWLTFRDFFAIPGMGVRSILEFAVILEQAMDIARGFYSNQSIATLKPSSSSASPTSNDPITIHKIADVPLIDLDTPIRQCDLPVRAIHCLTIDNILVLRDLLSRTAFDLLRLPNCGRKTLRDIETFLAVYSLSLGQVPEDLEHDRRSSPDNPEQDPLGKDQEALLLDLAQLEGIVQQPWAEQVFGSDPRFSDLLPFRKGSVYQIIDGLLSAWDLRELTIEDQRRIHLLALEADNLRQRVEEISQLKLDDALDQLFEKVTRQTGVRKSVLMRRMGWSPASAITLERAGDLLDLTRERIRQIQERLTAKINSHLPTQKVFLPQLEQAIDVLERSLPLTTTEASCLLRDKGITTALFSIGNIQSVCERLHHDCSFLIVNSGPSHGNQQVLVSVHETTNVRSLLQVARRLAGASGIANIYDVAERVASGEEDMDPRNAALVLGQASNVIEFLSDDWFWVTNIPNDRNRLRNTCRRMLSVVSPISLKEIRTGLRRHYSYRASSSKHYSETGRSSLRVPPLDVLGQFFKKHPEFTIDEQNLVSSVPFLDYRKELGDTERTMVDVLRSSPSGLLDRNSFRRQCVSRGMNPTTFDMYTSFSPIISHPDLNVWGLRGMDVNPAAIAAIQEANAQRSREKRVQDFGWSNEGNIWLKVRLGQNVQSFVVGCPSGISKYILGCEFSAFGDDDQRCGTIKSSGSSLYGFSPYLRKAGADEGDVLEIVFNIEKGEAYLSLSPEDALADAV
jgi:Bacterial RNA polymerase, alpha chain C terminal domain